MVAAAAAASPVPDATATLGPDGPYTLEAFAVRAGRYRWFEQRLFEVLGGWVATQPEPDLQILWSTHSYRHARHAELWRARLPFLPGRAEAVLTAPADDRLVAFFTDLAAAPPGDGGGGRLVVAYAVVLPSLQATYAAHRLRATVVADAPALRAIDLIMADLALELAEGRARLAARLVDPADNPAEGPTAVAMAGALAAAGGVAGDQFEAADPPGGAG